MKMIMKEMGEEKSKKLKEKQKTKNNGGGRAKK